VVYDRIAKLSALYPSSGILKTTKNVSETVSVYACRRWEEDIYSVGSFRKS
jgi:hypothetical protein